MMFALKKMIGSKKAIAAVTGMIVVGASRLGLDLPEETVGNVVNLIMAYIVGQGFADIGKEAQV